MINLNPCKRMLVWAVGLDNDRLSRARNGNVGGCTGEEGKCGCIHAEINLLKKMPHPETVIVSHAPCFNCAVALVDAGVKRVFYHNKYRKIDGLIYLAAHGIDPIFIRRSLVDDIVNERR